MLHERLNFWHLAVDTALHGGWKIVVCAVNTTEDRGVKFTKVLAFISSFATVTVAVAALAGRTSLTLVTSLLVEEGKESVGLPWRAAAAGFHLVAASFRMFGFWLQCNSVVYFSFGMLSMLEGMAPPNRGHSSSSRWSDVSAFRAAPKFSMDFRALGVLQAHYAALYMHYIALIQTASMYAVTFNAYQAVMEGSIRALLLALAITFGHVQFIEATAKVYDTSNDVLKKWRNVGRKNVPVWFPRFLRSCRNVYVPVGTFFYIDRALVLTVLSIITDASSSLILANWFNANKSSFILWSTHCMHNTTCR